ncbi:MAG: transposase [bacterium]
MQNQKFQNKYRIETTRLNGFNYSSDNTYFITICVKDKQRYFGKIIEEKMRLSEVGKIAQKLWSEIPNHFPFVELDEFSIMPNHIHGILTINKQQHCNDNNCRDAINRVSTRDGGITGKFNPMLNSASLPKIIRWFKGRATFEIRKCLDNNFQWQSRFYDRIIRNQNEMDKIRKYIFANPTTEKENFLWEK